MLAYCSFVMEEVTDGGLFGIVTDTSADTLGNFMGMIHDPDILVILLSVKRHQSSPLRRFKRLIWNGEQGYQARFYIKHEVNVRKFIAIILVILYIDVLIV